MGSSGMNWAFVGLANSDQASAGRRSCFCFECCSFPCCLLLSFGCVLLATLATRDLSFAVCYMSRACCMSLVALRLRLVLRAACCLRAHSTSLPHCAFPVAFFSASSTKSCPDFDFSGRELRL